MIWSQNNIETCKDTDINEMFWSSKFEVERNDNNMFCDNRCYCRDACLRLKLGILK